MCCVTNRKVAGSNPDGVIGIFHWHYPSDRIMALGSTQPLTEMSTRSISWGKGGRCVRVTTLPPSCAFVTKSGNLNFLEPSGPLQTCNETARPLLARLHAMLLTVTLFINMTILCKTFPTLLLPSFVYFCNNSTWWRPYWPKHVANCCKKNFVFTIEHSCVYLNFSRHILVKAPQKEVTCEGY